MRNRICASVALVVLSVAVMAGPANAVSRSAAVTRAEITANLLTAKNVFGGASHPPTGHVATQDGLCGVTLPAPRIQVNRSWSSHTPAPPPKGGFTVIKVSGSAFKDRRSARAAVRLAYNSETKCSTPQLDSRFQRHFAHTTAYCTVIANAFDQRANDDICRFIRGNVRYTVEVSHYGPGTKDMLQSLTSRAVKKVYR
jgi:hypothetical protein